MSDAADAGASPLAESARAPLVTVGAVGLFLLLGFVLFGSTGHDDSHITYWAALALRRYGEIINYNGDRVEQSSSLAHVVLLALLNAATRVSIPTLGPLTSIAGGAASIVLAGKLGSRLVSGVPAARWGAEVLVATAAPVVYWSFGGLESTLFAAASLGLVLAWARVIDGEARRLGAAAVVTAIFLCLRPEAPIVVGCILLVALAHAARRGAPSLRAALILAVVTVALVALLFAFRRSYFGASFPNPVYSKATTLAPAAGLAYLKTNLLPAGIGLVVATLLGLFFVAKDIVTTGRSNGASSPAPGSAGPLAAAFAVTYTSFIVLTGGDWMAGGRFVAHVLPLLVVLAVAAVVRALTRQWRREVALAALAYANLYGVLTLADGISLGRPIWTTGALRSEVESHTGPRGYSWFEIVNTVHLRDTVIAAELLDLVTALREAEPTRPLRVLTGQAGMVAYHVFAEHLGALHLVDSCSLATLEPRSCVPPALLERRLVGMVLPLERYFAEEAKIDALCGTERPDIVFGLEHRGDAATLQRQGYTLVVQQRGRIESYTPGRRWLRTILPAGEFIAVDTALLDRAHIAARPPWTWDIR